jgi:hypothetical protein
VATEGPRFPGTTANVSTGTENTDAWTGVGTPGNVSADDGTECTIVAASYDSPDISQRLRCSNFGFTTLNDAATINGITVEIQRRSIVLNSGKDFRVQLVDETGAIVGANKADTVTVWPTTATTVSYGGASDTWTWGTVTGAKIKNANFGVVLSAQANIANADIGVDFIRITVDYTDPVVPGFGGVVMPPMRGAY